jgi:hypothetical protein
LGARDGMQGSTKPSARMRRVAMVARWRVVRCSDSGGEAEPPPWRAPLGNTGFRRKSRHSWTACTAGNCCNGRRSNRPLGSWNTMGRNTPIAPTPPVCRQAAPQRSEKVLSSASLFPGGRIVSSGHGVGAPAPPPWPASRDSTGFGSSIRQCRKSTPCTVHGWCNSRMSHRRGMRLPWRRITRR